MRTGYNSRGAPDLDTLRSFIGAAVSPHPLGTPIDPASSPALALGGAVHPRPGPTARKDLVTYKVRLVSGRTYVIRANGKSTRAGTLVDPFLVLGRVSDNNFITDNDNGGQGLSAKLTYTPTTTENFNIVVSSSAAGERGTYRLKVTKK